MAQQFQIYNPHPHKFLILVSNSWVVTLFVSYWSAYKFFISNMVSNKSANTSHSIDIMKMLRQTPMRIHDLAGESAVYYQKMPSSLLSAFMKEILGS
jgi:hypothetical protein